MQIVPNPLVVVVVASLFCSSCLCAETEAATKTRTLQQLEDVDKCIMQTVFSFLYPASYPPTNKEALKDTCKRQVEAQKCTKEKAKAMTGIMKRGILTLVQNRQRHNKKVCANPDSEVSRAFLAGMSCIMEKKFPLYKQIDSNYSNTVLEIKRQNFNNSATELKYLCCNLANYKKLLFDNIEPHCGAYRATIEEMFNSIVPTDMSLVCEDEDKLLAQVCPPLAPLQIAKSFEFKLGNSPAVNSIYLFATLGESESDGKANG